MKFSIIIPVYNDCDNLLECLKALSKSTHIDDSEVLIINDGSTDGFSKNIEQIQTLLPNFRIINQEHKGLSAARNLGLLNASGDYVYFVDSDDIPDTKVLRRAWEECTNNNLDVLFFSFDSFADDNCLKEKYAKHLIGEKRKYEYDKCVLSGRELHTLFVRVEEYFPMVWLQVTRRKFLEENNIYFDEQIIYEDNLYTFKVLMYAKRSLCVNEILYHKRIRENSITTNPETVWSVYSFLYTYIGLADCIEKGIVENNPYSVIRRVYRIQSSFSVMLEDIRKQLLKRYERLSHAEQLELETKCNKIEREILLVLVSKISVIIPLYNTEQFVEECIQSVLKQTVHNLEVIVIDDGSNDDSCKIVNQNVQTDNRIKFFSQENKGSASARNLGMREASGDYIAFLDSDDMYFSEDALEKMMLTSIRHKVSVCGSYRVELRKNRIIQTSFLRELGDLPSEGKVFEFYEFQYDFFFQSYIYKADFLKKNNITFPLYLRYEDPVFLLRVMDACHEFCISPVILHCYRKGHQDYSHNGKYIYYNLLGIRDNLLISENKYNKLFDLTIERIEKMFIKDIASNMDENVRSVLREINRIYKRRYPERNGIDAISEYL